MKKFIVVVVLCLGLVVGCSNHDKQEVREVDIPEQLVGNILIQTKFEDTPKEDKFVVTLFNQQETPQTIAYLKAIVQNDKEENIHIYTVALNIEIPANGTYEVTLSDGTHIHDVSQMQYQFLDQNDKVE